MSIHPAVQSLLSEIDLFRARTGMSVTAFGKAALNDPHLIRDLQCGRNFGVATLDRVRAFMAGEREGVAA